jgi:hypothetical protein
MLRDFEPSVSMPVKYREAFLMMDGTVYMCVSMLNQSVVVQTLTFQSSARRLRSSTHRRHALTPSSTSHSYALSTNFSSLFRRSQLNTDESIQLQQPPPRSAVSGHSPHAIDVAAVRDKEVHRT